MKIQIDVERAKQFLSQGDFALKLETAAAIQKQLYEQEDKKQVLGWLHVETAAVQLEALLAKAEQVRCDAEVFVVVGVGGSNQAARAMIEALQVEDGPQIIYLGNSLSPYYIRQQMKKLEGKSVYINVIAKNFETLEPGSHFRILRRYMEQRYDAGEMAKRVILTGTYGSRLEEIAKENGYFFLPFPKAIGGRYSAFSPVGLFPVAVAGLDVDSFLKGVQEAKECCRENLSGNPAAVYGAVRNLLYETGYDIEMLVSFEPQLAFFSKWWIQLFGESEGKEGKGIFPSSAIYSEDLHSMGQYMQEGRRCLIETFLDVQNLGASVAVEADSEFGDGFDYLDGKDFAKINEIAKEATLSAHTDGGVPCLRFVMEDISEETFGSLYYIFMMGCSISGILMGVNPFDQEGVESYKKSMFQSLGKQ